jgi:gamma-glutamylcyclotransferase (GGCT)/AIG2-like uncharacterized protein YtfP
VQLFCYGTLMIPAVWLRVVGRPREATEAFLEDFVCRQVRGEWFPGLLPKSGARTKGVLYRGLTERELARLDRYEGAAYERRRLPVYLASGKKELAWCFVTRKPYRRRLSREPWSPRHLVGVHLASCLKIG